MKMSILTWLTKNHVNYELGGNDTHEFLWIDAIDRYKVNAYFKRIKLKYKSQFVANFTKYEYMIERVDKWKN